MKKIFLLTSLLSFFYLTGCNNNDNETNPEPSEEPAKIWDAFPIDSFSGNYDYLKEGTSLTSTEKSCDYLIQNDISIQLPEGATVKKAYLFWASSGKNDTQVTLDGDNISSLQTKQSNFKNLKFYKNYAEITSIVEEKGSGAYNFSDLDYSKYCRQYATLGVGTILVVYEKNDLPAADLHVYYPDLSSMNYAGELIRENYHIPDASTEDCEVPCEEKEIKICIGWCEGDNYKPEYCKLWTKELGENTLNGSTAPNLDLDEYDGFGIPTDRIFPIDFKAYWTKPRRFEGAIIKCVVIKVIKGDKGNVCSCLKDKDGNPIANHTFEIENEDGETIEITTDEDGKWCKDLPAGDYELIPGDGFELEDDVNFTVKACTCLELPCATLKEIDMGCEDNDNDGVCNEDDECPDEAGPIENDGCPDINPYFESANDLAFNTEYVSIKPSFSNPENANIIATPTNEDQSTLDNHYLISIKDFDPTNVGATFQTQLVWLKGILDYGEIKSKTHNIDVEVTITSYDEDSQMIEATYTGTFEEQGTGNTRTFNINGSLRSKYED